MSDMTVLIFFGYMLNNKILKHASLIRTHLSRDAQQILPHAVAPSVSSLSKRAEGLCLAHLQI